MARPEIRIVCDDIARHEHGRAVVITTYERHDRNPYGEKYQWLRWFETDTRTGTLLNENTPVRAGFPSTGYLINALTPHAATYRGNYTWSCEDCPAPKSKVETTDSEMQKVLDHVFESGIHDVPLRIIERGITGR